MKATAAFVIFFLMIAPKTRALLTGWMSQAGDWVVHWAPLSYLVIALILAAPLAAAMLMIKWPKTVEPENPLSRYKQEDVLD